MSGPIYANGTESRAVDYRVRKWITANLNKVIIISFLGGISVDLGIHVLLGWINRWILVNQFQLFCFGK